MMSDIPYRILVVEDEDRWRTLLKLVLERKGFLVDTAPSAARAWDMVHENLYHLLVLDIRMEDNQEDNEDGMVLLKEFNQEGLGEAFQVIILSAYGTQQQMRVAFRDYQVADFIDKHEFDAEEFIKNVQEVLTQQAKLGHNVEILWDSEKGCEEAVTGLQIGGSRISRRDKERQVQVGSELEELLRRLFYDAESILVRPLVRGSSGAGILWVQPFYPSAGAARPTVVKFGEPTLIGTEYQNFKRFVESFVGGGRNTTVRTLRRTQNLGGIVYTMLGTSNEQLEDFGTFYRRQAINTIQAAIDNLFQDTCAAWYANVSKIQPLDLSVAYQNTLKLSRENLLKAMEDKPLQVQGEQKLFFRALPGSRSFANPILALANHRFIKPTYTCVTHGDFNEGNILVDSLFHTWLIDFYHTGPGHILRDIARLDTVIRIHFLSKEDASLEERLHLEEALNQHGSWGDVTGKAGVLSTTNQALAKAFATSIYLRQWAYRLISKNPASDFSEYQVASLYYALSSVRYYSLATVQREHGLLAASLLTEKLI